MRFLKKSVAHDLTDKQIIIKYMIEYVGLNLHG